MSSIPPATNKSTHKHYYWLKNPNSFTKESLSNINGTLKFNVFCNFYFILSLFYNTIVQYHLLPIEVPKTTTIDLTTLTLSPGQVYLIIIGMEFDGEISYRGAIIKYS